MCFRLFVPVRKVIVPDQRMCKKMGAQRLNRFFFFHKFPAYSFYNIRLGELFTAAGV